MVNRKYMYDGFTVNYMMREQIHFGRVKKGEQIPPGVYIPEIKCSASYTYKDIVSWDIFQAIQKNTYGKDVGIGPKQGYRDVSYKTVRNRLEELKKEHVLVRIPKSTLSRARRRDNRKPYKLHPDTLYAYLRFLLTVLGRGLMSESRIYRLIPEII